MSAEQKTNGPGYFFTVPKLIGLKWGTRPRESPPTGAAGGGGDHRADN